MVCATYMSIFAMMAAMTATTSDASTGFKACYNPWRHHTLTEELIIADLKLSMVEFVGIRSFETLWGNLNAIDMAAAANAKIVAGVQMNDLSAVDKEIKAVCDGYYRNPEALHGVWVGNENLKGQGGYGTVSAKELIGYIKQVRDCTDDKVFVGTAQRITEWLTADGAHEVYNASTKVGSNMYPFFTQGSQSPIEKLEAQWVDLQTKYNGGTKFVISETGYPSAGTSAYGNEPSLAIAQHYLNDFTKWLKTHQSYTSWFMMFDSKVTYTGEDYEMHFGVYGLDGTPKYTFPDSGGSTPTESLPFDATPANTSGITPGFPNQRYAVGVPLSRQPEVTGHDQDQGQHNAPSATTPQANAPSVHHQDQGQINAPSATTPQADAPYANVPSSGGFPMGHLPDVPESPPAASTPTIVQSGKDCAM